MSDRSTLAWAGSLGLRVTRSASSGVSINLSFSAQPAPSS
jgi:hypothetical protein